MLRLISLLVAVDVKINDELLTSPEKTWTACLYTSAYLTASNEPLFCYSGINGRNTS